MPSVTVTCEADASAWESPKYAAGLGNHLPVGHYGSADYHSILRFDSPSWGGWSRITKATLNIYTSDFDHVGPRNSSIYVRRQSLTSGTTAPVWTGSEGSQSCESGFSTGTPDIDNMNAVTTGQASFSSGTTANAKKSIDVTTMVTYYRDSASGKITFVLSPVGSGDYSEFWSRHKSGGYDISLVIDYEDNDAPTTPTQYGPSGVQVSQTPTFDWAHNDPDGDAQVQGQVRIWNSTGTMIAFEGAPWNVTTATQLTNAIALSRGSSYMWDVRTYDGEFWSPWSAKKAFSIKANPVVTITPTRYMSLVSGVPRLTVKWGVSGGTQKKYRVTAPGYDSGWLTSTATSHVLSTLALTNGASVAITVAVETTEVLQGTSPAVSFTPRWGVTVHRRDLGTDPVTGWGTPTIASTVPSGASLVVEYNANASGAVPTTWFSALSSAPKARYVFYRAWFIPSASAGPTLHSIVIPAQFAVETADHWHGTIAANSLPGAQWSIDTGEYVYGTRSITCENNGVTQGTFSKRIKVRAGRSYILTGLMRAEGNSGAAIQLYDSDAGAVLSNETGDLIQTEVLVQSREWFEADQLDVYRYASPIWVAPSDMDVQIRLRSSGVVGTQSWFDAIKLEESTVATPWNPAAVGAVSLDAGGVQVDGTKGGVFRLRGSTGGARDTVELGSRGLLFGGIHMYAASATEIGMDFTPGGGNAILRLTSVATAPGIYSAYLVNMSGDGAARAVFGRSGDVDRTGMFLGPGNAARDVALYRASAEVLNFNNAIKFSGAEAGAYQAITLYSGGTDAGGTIIDHGTGGSIQGRIMGIDTSGNAREVLRWDGTTAGRIGFYGAAPAGVVGRQNVTGAKGGNVALTNLLTALHNLGIINNTTT